MLSTATANSEDLTHSSRGKFNFVSGNLVKPENSIRLKLERHSGHRVVCVLELMGLLGRVVRQNL